MAAPCDASKFDDFLSTFIPQKALAPLRQNISNQYPSKNYENSTCPQGDQVSRVSNVIRDAVFTCNTRLLYDAYQVKSGVPTYMMQYSISQSTLLNYTAVHASDLLPTFWNSYVNYTKSLSTCFNVKPLVAPVIAKALKAFAPPYQSYFASHAVTGDPNKNAIGKAKWQVASVTGGSLTNVMKASIGITPSFTNYTDPTNSAASCDFWKGIAAAIQPASGSAEYLGLMVQDASVRGSIEL